MKYFCAIILLLVSSCTLIAMDESSLNFSTFGSEDLGQDEPYLNAVTAVLGTCTLFFITLGFCHYRKFNQWKKDQEFSSPLISKEHRPTKRLLCCSVSKPWHYVYQLMGLAFAVSLLIPVFIQAAHP